MPSQPQTAKEIFVELIGSVPADQWKQRLPGLCQGDDDLLRRVNALLKAHADPSSFLGAPPSADAIDPGPTTAGTAAERPGMQIGPYKLLQVIGEGGMGVVYMAEQKEPVERRVALKIIKPGMDSRQVIARFEAERQALAMMDHPNIAKIFDAGMTGEVRSLEFRMQNEEESSAATPQSALPTPHSSAGRPYFVMELVKGVPITKYCDEKHLSLKERLELMIPVCQAIQHAHQKGIIHRDIKPTNVLVAQYDGKPVPKVIDFGVAKATAQKLTERTMFTELGQIVGTLEYMSPEQAELNQLDIDTRSDIYSLGVLLYELLTGSTPFDKQKLRTAAFHEMLRIIREDEPPKPSTRLSTIDALPSVAAVRGTEPARLSKLVRGELDWIAMKALDKDRARRYETANAFAADIQRYLKDEPVHACPPSTGYRFGKFARKNKAALTTVALVVLSLIIGTLISTWQAIRATRAEVLAKANETRALAEEQKAKAAAEAEKVQRRRAEQQAHTLDNQRKLLEQNNRVNTMLTDEILTVLRDLPISDAQRHKFFITSLKRLGKLDPKERVDAYHSAGNMFVGLNEFPAAISAYTEGLGINPRHTQTYVSRGDVFFRQKEFDKAVSDYTSAIENRRPKDPADGQLPYARRGFAWCRLNKFDQALADFRASYEASRQGTLTFLVQGFQGLGITNAPLEERLRSGVSELFDRHTNDEQRSPAARAFCSDSLAQLGLWDAARKHLQPELPVELKNSGLSYWRAVLALKCNDHPEYRRICAEMLDQHPSAEKWELAYATANACSLAPDALDDYTAAIATARRALTRQPNSARTRLGLGAILLRAGRFDEALPQLQAAIESKIDFQQVPYHAPYFLAMAYHQAGRSQEAAEWLRRAEDKAGKLPVGSAWTWRSQAVLELLRAEATQLIEPGSASGKPQPPDKDKAAR